MKHLLQKSINQSEVFVGGMYFENNTTELNLNNGLDYVNITGPFLPLTINSSFLVVNNSLTLLRRKNFTKLCLQWEFFSTSEYKMEIAFRIRKLDSKGNFNIIESTRVLGSSNDKVFGKTIVDVNSNDKFYAQVKNNDLKYPSQNLIIEQIELVLSA